MKRIVFVFASVAAFAISCTVNHDIFPDPSLGDAGPDASLSSSSSSSSSASSSSSGMSILGDGSGTRLKRYVYTSGDGLSAGQLNPFYDALLAIDCSPQKTPNGTRCMPANAGTLVGWYSDNQCTKLTVAVTKTCIVPQYAYTYTVTTCNTLSPLSYYSVTSPLQIVYGKSGATCVDVSSTVLSAYDIYDIGPEVDYAQFAAMTLEHE